MPQLDEKWWLKLALRLDRDCRFFLCQPIVFSASNSAVIRLKCAKGSPVNNVHRRWPPPLLNLPPKPRPLHLNWRHIQIASFFSNAISISIYLLIFFNFWDLNASLILFQFDWNGFDVCQQSLSWSWLNICLLCQVVFYRRDCVTSVVDFPVISLGEHSAI